jgi:hypothetical protein
MFILYAIVIGLVVGLALGGRPMALAEIRLRWWPLIALGFATQIVLFSEQVSRVIGDAGPPIYVASTLLVGVAVLRNLAMPGMPLIVLGAVSNMTAILANGGYMPSTHEALAAIGKVESTVYTNSALVDEPAFPWLIDRFVLPSWLPFANVFSVGDVLLGIGVAWLIVATMVRGRTREPARTTAAEGSAAR